VGDRRSQVKYRWVEGSGWKESIGVLQVVHGITIASRVGQGRSEVQRRWVEVMVGEVQVPITLKPKKPKKPNPKTLIMWYYIHKNSQANKVCS
jgi:hypothetical protein